MTQSNPKRALMAGAAWAVAMRWSVRALGFCNTLIMARLVLPADYGVVAMAMLVVGLVQALLDTGTTTALLRKGVLTRDEIDSAWTLRLLEFLAVGVLISIASYPAAIYFGELRVIPVLLVMASCIAVQGFSSIGYFLALKELNFAVEFRLAVLGKLIGVAFTVLGGLAFRDYRALVLGIAAGYLSSAVLSYTVHPYRARWNVSRIAEIWHLTKWLTFAGIASFSLRKGDELIAARIGGAQQFGLYNVGADLGQMPTGEVGPALLKAFLPVLSTIQDDVARTNRAVLKTIAAVNTLTMPIGTLVFVLAIPLTSLILGAGWQDAAPLVAVFAVISTIQILVSPLNTLLVLRGYTRLQSTIIWLEFAAFLLAAAILVPHFGIIGLAYARLVSTAANAALTTFHAHTFCAITYFGVVIALCRPTIGIALIALVFLAFGHSFAAPFLNAVMVAALGLLIYTIWVAGSWQLAGRPEGLESTIADRWRLRQARAA
jgi:O-antigen/teichoic acid export membrane protein